MREAGGRSVASRRAELRPGLWHWEAPHPQWEPTEPSEAHWYGAGDRLPVGVEAFPGQKKNDTVLLVESMKAVIAGDTLVDWGQGLQINPRWLHEGMTRGQVASSSTCCSSFQWSTCSSHTGGRPIAPPSSALSPRLAPCPRRNCRTPAQALRLPPTAGSS